VWWRRLPRKLFGRLTLSAGPSTDPLSATPDAMRAQVMQLRGGIP